MFLLQKRLCSYFQGEYYDDVAFSNHFLRLYNSLIDHEEYKETSMLFSDCLADIANTVFNLKFTKQGVRIAG